MSRTPDVADDYPRENFIRVPEDVISKLSQQRFVVKGDRLYACYPIPATYCSRHRQVHSQERSARDVMAHLCGREHLNRMVRSYGGGYVMDPLGIIEICGICGRIPHNIRQHLWIQHRTGVFHPYVDQDLSATPVVGVSRTWV